MLNPEDNNPNPGGLSIIHLLNLQQFTCFDELIATSEAVFNFVRFSKLDRGFKDAFYQLEKQFDYYKTVLTKES